MSAQRSFQLAPGSDLFRGRSAALRVLRDAVVQAAASDATVLLSGETGSGKSLVARELHRCSPRADHPFVVADCAGLAPSLLESELFGHARGAFTGAVVDRRGRFEAAGAGTLFLDDIGELPPPLQARLLRALQDRQFERVGSVEPHSLRARVIAASWRDLAREVEEGHFRADLFFRLHVLRIRVPPLRERPEDIPDLAISGLAHIAARAGRPAPAIAPGALECLVRHDWPGNVRELLNLLERLWLTLPPGCDRVGAAEVERSLVDHPVPRPAAIAASRQSAERAALLAALEEARGNVTRAARSLGLPRSTLRYRMQQHGLG